jgi:hypothetical protein
LACAYGNYIAYLVPIVVCVGAVGGKLLLRIFKLSVAPCETEAVLIVSEPAFAYVIEAFHILQDRDVYGNIKAVFTL